MFRWLPQTQRTSFRPPRRNVGSLQRVKSWSDKGQQRRLREQHAQHRAIANDTLLNLQKNGWTKARDGCFVDNYVEKEVKMSLEKGVLLHRVSRDTWGGL